LLCCNKTEIGQFIHRADCNYKLQYNAVDF
jgi:hypothetical protein